MKRHYVVLLGLISILASCSEAEKTPGLAEEELEVIDYFKEVALGFEFGSASEVTRKWKSQMKIYVGGQASADLLEELETIRGEINVLVTDGFAMQIVSDSSESNFYLFFGSGADYARMFPSQANQVRSNWGLFSIYWNSSNQLHRGHMYEDVYKASETEQKHLLREELTQSLGLAKDSPDYPESIFQSEWTFSTEYAPIDKNLIRLLYHPRMSVGLDAGQAESVLKTILSNE